MARPLGDEPAHGTRKRYQLRRAPCRCELCRDANARFIKSRRQSRENHRRSWQEMQPKLPPEYLPSCSHSLMAGASKCAWCGEPLGVAA